MTKDQFMQFRVPMDLKQKAIDAADQNHESISEVLRRCLEKYVEDTDRGVEEGLFTP